MKTLKALVTGIVLLSAGAADGRTADDERRFLEDAPRLQRPETPNEARARISRQFSQADGSHILLTRYLQKRLRAPESYVHIKTDYRQAGTRLHVATTYRAKNGKGEYCTERVEADITLEGALLQVRNV